MTRAQDDEIVARFASVRRADAKQRAGSYQVILRDADHMDFAGGGNGAIAGGPAYLMAFLGKRAGVPGTVLDVATPDPTVWSRAARIRRLRDDPVTGRRGHVIRSTMSRSDR